jgi:peptidoglycan biosynthesis protein MviN/MurJ (putative lipid II flippase)
MGVEGLALALSISAVLEVLGLLWSLHRRIESVEEASLLRSAARASIAAGASALLMLGGLTLVEGLAPGLLDNGLGRLVALLALGSAGVAIFLLVASALRSPELEQLRGLLPARLRRSR